MSGDIGEPFGIYDGKYDKIFFSPSYTTKFYAKIGSFDAFITKGFCFDIPFGSEKALYCYDDKNISDHEFNYYSAHHEGATKYY